MKVRDFKKILEQYGDDLNIYIMCSQESQNAYEYVELEEENFSLKDALYKKHDSTHFFTDEEKVNSWSEEKNTLAETQYVAIQNYVI